MRTLNLAGLLILAGAPLAAQAADVAGATHSLSANLTLASEYLYRGISQTNGRPALQGGFDYSHASGLYAGVWGSNVSWLADATAGVSAPLELDVYGGYKGQFGGAFSHDIGVLTYNYPGSYPAGHVDADTTEVYGALGWQWLSLKYSHVVSSHVFGFTSSSGGKTRGSGYLDLSASHDLGNGWGINAHAGHQRIKGNAAASYSDYRLGLTKDVGFGNLGLHYSSTTAKGEVGEPYRNALGRDLGQERLVLSFSKTF